MAKADPRGVSEPDDLADLRYSTPLSVSELPDFGTATLDELDRLDWTRRRQEYRNRPEGEGPWSGPIASRGTLRLSDLVAQGPETTNPNPIDAEALAPARNPTARSPYDYGTASGISPHGRLDRWHVEGRELPSTVE